MILNTVTVELADDRAGPQGARVRFLLDATIESDYEAQQEWLLKVDTDAIGTKQVHGRQVLCVKQQTEVVGPSLTPNGRSLGDNWRPAFEYEFKGHDAAYKKGDIYFFKCRLVPDFRISESGFTLSTPPDSILGFPRTNVQPIFFVMEI